ncbi:MAG: LLM class flavin-dependent oxidoreductase [Pseudomonadota bacterium]
MHTCTWAPSTFSGTRIVKNDAPRRSMPDGDQLQNIIKAYVGRVEALGLSHLLIAQRWWGNAEEIEGSSLDCLTMTDFIAAHTSRVRLVTAIHPGFFQPAIIAKWASTLDNLTKGRWSINVTSGWNLEEFKMYGVDPLSHDERYLRSSEFIEVLRGAWEQSPFTYAGAYFHVDNLQLEPRPLSQLEVFQGGQSPAAIEMACRYSDWMFLNGGSLEKIRETISHVRSVGETIGRCPRFAVYGIPVCRETDAEAEGVITGMLDRVDSAMLEKRKQRVSGAEGMWSRADQVGLLDTNEGYSTGLIGSPATILATAARFKDAGVDMFHLTLGDTLFEQEVLPKLHAL